MFVVSCSIDVDKACDMAYSRDRALTTCPNARPANTVRAGKSAKQRNFIGAGPRWVHSGWTRSQRTFDLHGVCFDVATAAGGRPRKARTAHCIHPNTCTHVRWWGGSVRSSTRFVSSRHASFETDSVPQLSRTQLAHTN